MMLIWSYRHLVEQQEYFSVFGLKWTREKKGIFKKYSKYREEFRKDEKGLKVEFNNFKGREKIQILYKIFLIFHNEII